MQEPTPWRHEPVDDCEHASTESQWESEVQVPSPDITGRNLTGHAFNLLNILWLGTSRDEDT